MNFYCYVPNIIIICRFFRMQRVCSWGEGGCGHTTAIYNIGLAGLLLDISLHLILLYPIIYIMGCRAYHNTVRLQTQLTVSSIAISLYKYKIWHIKFCHLYIIFFNICAKVTFSLLLQRQDIRIKKITYHFINYIV